jgi:hypothetical protein
MKMTDSVDKLAKLYVNEVIRLYGVPVSIYQIGIQGSRRDYGLAYNEYRG